MLPLLAFHPLVARRGDGLRPELLALLSRCPERNVGLSARFEIEETCLPRNVEPDAPSRQAAPK
ncbi:hypothetical protein [Caballeronia cordobensis]|uniref:hypothetical protein n=2 Tax=Caballeronia TaxID=1827195 RepID=UPI00045EDEFF|nr:uncharacterized protein BRPE67_ACDS25600 [Burkholderia sp. RPE67]